MLAGQQMGAAAAPARRWDVYRLCRRQHGWFQQPPVPVPLCVELSKPRRPRGRMTLQWLISSAVTPTFNSPQTSAPLLLG